MTTTTQPNDLVRGLRYRRWLGRQKLVRGTTPSRPRIKYGLAPGCLGVVLVIVAIYVVILVALAIQMALYVVAALAALLVVRPFSRFALPALRGGVFNGSAFAETPAAGMFVLGAVPTTALVYPLSHGLPMLAGPQSQAVSAFAHSCACSTADHSRRFRSTKESMQRHPSVRTSATPATSASGSARQRARSPHSVTRPVSNGVQTSR